MDPELVKWITGLHPGDVSAFGLVVLALVLILVGSHKSWYVSGSEHTRTVDMLTKQIAQKDADNAALKAALDVANRTLTDERDTNVEQRMELVRLRLEREYQWRPPPPAERRKR